MSEPAIAGEPQDVEAARYALLRRLALSMRHHMVVHLQPMSMIGELLNRRLSMPEPDLAQVHESMARINELSRQAVDACLDVVGWLAPPPDARVGAAEGAREIVALLRTAFGFRGFTLREETGDEAAQVSHSALRHVLTAALFALTDRAPSPAEVVLRARPVGAQLEFSVDIAPGAGEPGPPGNHPYRLLPWHEVERLAAAEGGSAVREGFSGRIRLPLAA
jgi:hypothetical protein